MARWTFALGIAGCLAPGLSAQVHTQAVPTARITERVDGANRARLMRHRPAILEYASDLGRVSRNTRMDHLILVLQATPEQEHELKTLLDQQADRKTANYHKWVSPDEFGAHFGVAGSDISQVCEWLVQQGFSVDLVASGKRLIEFSGTVANVEAAFQTEMHYYDVGGQLHISANSEVSVPAAIRPVVAAIPTLHDFFKQHNHTPPRTVRAGRAIGPSADVSQPDATLSGTNYVGPADFATIYNSNPLLSAGINGKGVVIGILGRTDIELSDVQTYRQMFSLPPNDPNFIVTGEDPGIVPGDDGESDLDVEISGGYAPGATVDFFTARSTLTVDGVDLAGIYAVQNNLADIISESYSQCEYSFASPAAVFLYQNLWEQAAAQGTTVFVSAGDNGPGACDSQGSQTFSYFGYAVNGLASTPYNVSVGGTIFNEGSGTYWSASNSAGLESALGYIPEQPWNESLASANDDFGGLWSGSGGISAYYQTPSWQRGPGVPASDPAYPDTGSGGYTNDTAVGAPAGVSSPPSPFVAGPHRYMPDVALAAAGGHDGTLYCSEGICQLDSNGNLLNAGIVGGTSVAAPSWAGVQALINQYNGGGRQGLTTYQYYALAARQNPATCNGSATPPAPGPGCAFQDVTSGNNLICGDSFCTAGKQIGWTAGSGFDLATGLGTPNIANLATQWSSVVFASSLTTMNLSRTSGIVHGSSVTVSGTVTPGTDPPNGPSGDVAFLATSGVLGDPVNTSMGGFQNPLAFATLSGGSYSATLSNLPAGTYYVYARYGGDGTYASSTSNMIQVTVTSEGSTLTISPNALNGSTCTETPSTTFTYGDYIWTDAIVAGGSQQGVPSGTVSLTDNGNPLATLQLNSTGVGHLLSGAIPSSSCVNGYTFQDSAPLTAGTHVLGGSYSGDASFQPATATPVTVTINHATLGATLTTSATNIASGGAVQLTFTLAGINGAGPGTLNPTGSVKFTDTTTSTVLGTVSVAPNSTFGAAAILSTTGITAAGLNSITGSYSGDANYNSVMAAASVTVQSGKATTTTVTSNSNPSPLGGQPTFTAQVSSSSTTGLNGTVNFFDGQTLLGKSTLSGTTHTASFQPGTGVNLTAGTHTINAVYAGNGTYDSSSGSLSQVFSQASTSVQLTGKLSGYLGQSFTFSALLSGVITATPPTGTVQFYDGANPIGSPQSIMAPVPGGYGTWQATFATTALAAGTHTITAQFSGDASYTGSTSNAQTVVVTGPDLSISKAHSGNFTQGGVASFYILVTNNGPGPSVGTVTVTDPMPAGMTATGASGSGWTCTIGSTVTCSRSDPLAANTSYLAINVTGMLASNAGPFITNTATVSGGGDNTPGNNSWSDTAVVNAVAQPIVSGSVLLSATGTISGMGSGGWSAVMAITNRGTGTAQNVMLTAMSLGLAHGSTMPQTLGDIPPGGFAIATITFTARAGTAGELVLERISGRYKGGSFGDSYRVFLPGNNRRKGRKDHAMTGNAPAFSRAVSSTAESPGSARQ
jgi:hypothetical protein